MTTEVSSHPICHTSKTTVVLDSAASSGEEEKGKSRPSLTIGGQTDGDTRPGSRASLSYVARGDARVDPRLASASSIIWMAPGPVPSPANCLLPCIRQPGAATLITGGGEGSVTGELVTVALTGGGGSPR